MKVKDLEHQKKSKRILEIINLSKAFLEQVKTVRADVFTEDGLPTLRIKDLIRSVKIKLREFSKEYDETKQSRDRRL